MRRAFTLVELLVVMLIILAIAALVVAFAPKLAERQKVPRGADLLQGWLLQTKQRAKRDQLPTGVRLVPDANGLVTSLQYIQKPDDFNGGGIEVGSRPEVDSGLRNYVWAFAIPPNIPAADFSGGFDGTDTSLWPVQPGDYIELKGGGLVRRIAAVHKNHLVIDPKSSFPYPVQPTADFRVIRHMRPLAGEANLDLPKGIVIDVSTNTKYGNPLAPLADGAIDLIFSPSGPLLDCVGSDGVVCLWVRDATADPVLNPDGSILSPAEFQMEPILVAIYKTTGLIANHPVASDQTNPYRFAKDGRSSGL